MPPQSTNEKIVVEMATYKRRTVASKPLQESPETAEESLKEIAHYLLMAVRVITARPRH